MSRPNGHRDECSCSACFYAYTLPEIARRAEERPPDAPRPWRSGSGLDYVGTAMRMGAPIDAGIIADAREEGRSPAEAARQARVEYGVEEREPDLPPTDRF